MFQSVFGDPVQVSQVLSTFEGPISVAKRYLIGFYLHAQMNGEGDLHSTVICSIFSKAARDSLGEIEKAWSVFLF